MAELRMCSETLPHRFHGFHEEVETWCSGETRCGVQTHEPHTFKERRSFWCRGVCDCGLITIGPHGPGEHK